MKIFEKKIKLKQFTFSLTYLLLGDVDCLQNRTTATKPSTLHRIKIALKQCI